MRDSSHVSGFIDSWTRNNSMLERAPMAYPSVGLNLNYKLYNREAGGIMQEEDRKVGRRVQWCRSLRDITVGL